MSDYNELLDILKHLLLNRFAPKPSYTRGLLGDGQGNVQVPGRPDKSYVRFNRGSSEYFEVFNRTVNPVNDWPILIGELPWQPGLTQVVDTDWSAFEQSGWGDSIGDTSPHAPTHEWPDGSPGSDPVNVHLRSIVPLRAYALTGTTVYVNSLEYEYQGSGHVWGGLPGVDLSPVISDTVTGSMRYAGIYLEPTSNSLAVVTGSTTVHSSALTPPLVQFPQGVVPAGRVKIYGNQAAINEADIVDARRPFNPASTGTSSGGAPTGDAGGDLTGSYPNPQVAGLFGSSLLSDTPAEGNLLMFSGSAWRPLTVGSLPPDGLAGGDLTGSYPNPSVAGLYGYSLLNTAPAEGNLLMFSGSAWRPVGNDGLSVGCVAYHNADQTISNVTVTALALNSEIRDDDGFHDTVTNNSRITIPAGREAWYNIYGNISWEANSGGENRGIGIRLNGSIVIAFGQNKTTSTPNSEIIMNCACVYYLNAGDYVELIVYQDSGGDLDIDYFANYSPYLGVARA